jgi:hypothetical protein
LPELMNPRFRKESGVLFFLGDNVLITNDL